jgi:hypothetical protein
MTAMQTKSHRDLVLGAASEYLARGWKVVPVPKGGKKPVIDDWYTVCAQKAERDLSDLFRNGENIGVLLGEASNGLIDIDIDAPEALVFADEYLSDTHLVHGRTSKPRSHRWYVVPEMRETKQFRAPNKKMLIEIRGGRLPNQKEEGKSFQTIVPPSVHESGERIEWVENDDPMKADARDLQRRVAVIASGTLLAQHWPEEGARHNARLALAGMLLRAKWTEADTIKFMWCVNQAARCSANLSEVKSVVEDSAKKISNKQKAVGAPELVKLLTDGERVVSLVREWLQIGKENESPTDLIVYDLVDFLTEKFPESEPLIEIAKTKTPVFKTRSLNQIFAYRGTGKTMLALALGGAIAKGEGFLRWRAKRKARVLYVEGEMPADQLQMRAAALIGSTDPGFFRLLPFTAQVEDIQPLATAVGRKALENVLGDAEVLILDSISTLGWFATNDEEEWLELLHWLNLLRRRGLCIIFLHHAGKSGMQRGHSRSEDMLDVSIKLTREADDDSDWLRMTMEYDKFRSDRHGIRPLVVEYKEGQWLNRPKDFDKLKALEEYRCEHPTASARTIAKDLPDLGSHATVIKLIKKLPKFAADREQRL